MTVSKAPLRYRIATRVDERAVLGGSDRLGEFVERSGDTQHRNSGFGAELVAAAP